MQTFLPYPSFEKSATCLDIKRLGKQIIEVTQIYNALTNPLYGWKNHPAVKMWKSYEMALLNYGLACYNEWKSRRNRNHKSGEIIKMWLYGKNIPFIYPPWFNDDKFHASHRSNLLRKQPEFYSKFGWIETNNLEYVWPV